MTINTNDLVAFWERGNYSEDGMLENANALRDGLFVFRRNEFIDDETCYRGLRAIDKAVSIYSKKFEN